MLHKKYKECAVLPKAPERPPPDIQPPPRSEAREAADAGDEAEYALQLPRQSVLCVGVADRDGGAGQRELAALDPGDDGIAVDDLRALLQIGKGDTLVTLLSFASFSKQAPKRK